MPNVEAAIATSFDRFARYSYLRRVREQWFGPEPVRVLDVGDPYGTLTMFLPDDLTVSLDLFAERRGAFPRQHPHVVGSGFSLPFADGAFDIVGCHDVYEHLPVEGREVFVSELVRVSAGPVVLVAPFADPRTAACEAMVNAYYVSRTGATLEPLDEHFAGGLPPLAELESFLDALGVERHVHGDGWLFHWLPLMLMKAHMVAGGMAALDRAIDTACNQLLRERDARLPGYRRAVVIRPQGGPVAPPWAEDATDVERSVHELTRLGWELVAVLRAGQDLSDPGCDLRQWVTAARSRGGDLAVLAESLDLALDRARQTLAGIGGPAALPLAVTAVLVATEEAADGMVATLRQLADQDDVSDEIEVVVVTSSNATAQALTAKYPRVQVVVENAPDRATRLNRGVAAAGGEAVLLLDPDVQFDRHLVASLVSAFDVSSRTLCVGASLEGGAANPILGSVRADGDAALYASASAMLVQRKLYLDLGGLDAAFHGALEDVDLGWRITNLGYRVARSPVVVRFVPDRTGAPPEPEPEPVFSDGDVLRMLVKNLEPANLAVALSAEVLGICRGAAEDGRSGSEAPGRAVEAVAEVVDDLDELLRARDALLPLRQVGDGTVLERFGRPGRGGPVLGAVDRASGTRTSVLVVADERRVAHSVELARLAGLDGRVTLATSAPLADLPATLDLASYGAPAALTGLAAVADVVLAPAPVVHACPALRDTAAALVIDLRDAAVDGPGGQISPAVLQRGDAFLVSSERQRDHWLGHLHALGRPTASEQEADPSLRRLIDVVHTAPADVVGQQEPATGPLVVIDLAPVGADSPQAGLLLSEVPALAASGVRVVLTAAETPAHSAPALADLLASGHANIGPALLTGSARVLALSGASVVARPTGPDETARLASASWALDAVAVGAALVVTSDDPAADLVGTHGCGAVVHPPARVADAIRHLLDDPGRLSAAQAASQAFAAGVRAPGADALVRRVVRSPWGWQRVADPGPAEHWRTRVAAAKAQMEHQRAALSAAETLLTARAELIDGLQRRLAEVDEELDRLRRSAGAVDGNPAVRAARRLSRLLEP